MRHIKRFQLQITLSSLLKLVLFSQRRTHLVCRWKCRFKWKYSKQLFIYRFYKSLRMCNSFRVAVKRPLFCQIIARRVWLGRVRSTCSSLCVWWLHSAVLIPLRLRDGGSVWKSHTHTAGEDDSLSSYSHKPLGWIPVRWPHAATGDRASRTRTRTHNHGPLAASWLSYVEEITGRSEIIDRGGYIEECGQNGFKDMECWPRGQLLVLYVRYVS